MFALFRLSWALHYCSGEDEQNKKLTYKLINISSGEDERLDTGVPVDQEIQ
jgi:hypothetical protein